MNDKDLAECVKSAYHMLNLVRIDKGSLVLYDGWDLENILYGEDPDGMRPFGAVFTYKETTIVAFRGTEAWSEWYTDAEMQLVKPSHGVGLVHKGFLDLYNSLVDKNENSDWRASIKVRNAYITGHSLGAALATFTALDVNSRMLTTFGSPKCGDQEWATKASESLGFSKRYVSKFDPVPMLPLSTWHVNFQHICPQTLIYDKDNMILAPAQNHSLDRYIELVGNVVP